MAPNLKNGVNPLAWNVPITNKDGTPTNEFQRKWGQQAGVNSSIPNLTTAVGVSARLDLLGALPGMLLERGATTWGGLASPADATKFLNGAAFPAYAAVKDSDLALSDIAANNVSSTKHGFAPKAPNDATKFLNGIGAYSTPASGGGGAASVQDDGVTVTIALSDLDGQLVLDGAGDPIFVPEVFPPAALPLASAAAFGAVKVDGSTVLAAAGVISAAAGNGAAVAFFVTLTSNQSVADATTSATLFNNVITDTLGAYNPATGKFTPPKTGKWLFFGSMQGQVATTINNVQQILSKNAASTIAASITGAFGPTPSISLVCSTLAVVAMNGTTDFIVANAVVSGTGGSDVIFANGAVFFGGVYLGT